jgi:hypothetical protein
MTIKSTIIAFAAAAALQGAGAEDTFRLNFRATCRALGPNERLDTTKLTERDIIAAATGVSNSASKQFTLVYNASTDSIQVADTNGTVITDVILFQGGASTSDGRRSARQTFMFVPNQTNAIGSAVITERAPSSSQNGTNRADINGIVQFALTDDMTLGQTNVTGTNGLGTTGTNGLSGIAPFTPAITTNMSGLTNGLSSTNTVENTNSVSGTNNAGATNVVGGSTNGTGTTTATGPGNASNSGFFFSNGFLLQSNGLSNVRICVGTFTTSRRASENGVNTTNGITTGVVNSNNVSGNTTNNISGTTTNSVSGTTTNNVSVTTTNGVGATTTNAVMLSILTNQISTIRP